MSEKKIIDMDDLMLDNISIDDLTTLPGVPDAASDWKHKGAETSAPTVNLVDELDISSVDLSSLDPEQEDFVPKNNDNSSLFTAAPAESENVNQSENVTNQTDEPVKTHSAIDDIMSKFKGGFEVKTADETNASAPKPNYTESKPVYTEPAPIKNEPEPVYTKPVETVSESDADLEDIVPGLDFKLPEVKKVSLSGDFSKPLSVDSVSAQSVATPEVKVPEVAKTPVEVPKKSVEIPDELPPLKSTSEKENKSGGISVEIPGMKKNTDNDLPPLKSNKSADIDLPPLKHKNESKSADNELPPLKPKKEEKKVEEEKSKLPESTEKSEDEGFVYVAPKEDESGSLPADMSDVVAPKLDDMMADTVKKASFEQPENKIEGMADPFANKNISAARRKKLEEGFDGPVVMKKIDPETYWEIENNEKQERISKGKSSVSFIGIMYIIFGAAQFLGNLSVVTGIAFAIALFIGIKLIKGPAASTRIVYLVWGLINSGVGLYTVYSKGFIGYLSSDRSALGLEGWMGVITVGLLLIWFIVSLILIFTNKNINEFFRSLKNKDK